MPPFDTEGALKTAEKALRQERIDAAAEYVRIVAAQPRDWNSANIERFRRALVMPGESDPDSIIAERLSGESPFLATDKIDLNEDSYDLAETLENLGEHERALAAFVELEAESCANRDVAHRIERLSKAKAKR